MMNKCFFSYIRVTIFLLMPLMLCAQNSKELGTEEINVVKPYEPILADAVKIRMNPELPAIEAFEPDMSYSIPAKIMHIDYHPSSIKALAMRKEKPGYIANSYFKAGFGNYATSLLEAYYTNVRSKKFQYGAYAKHMSSKGKLENQAYSDNNLHVFSNAYFKKNILSFDLDYLRNVIHFYGYDNSDTSFTKDAVKQRYSAFTLNTVFYNHKPTKDSIDYNMALNYYNFSALSGDNLEDYLELSLEGSKTFANGDVINLHAIINPLFTQASGTTLIGVKPAYTVNKGMLTLTLGINAILDGETFNIFPGFVSSLILVEGSLIFYNGWTGDIEVNTYRSLINKNPFVTNSIVIQNSKVESRYAGIQGKFANKFSYDLRFSQDIVNNMPLFVNDTLDEKKFTIVYDDEIKSFNLEAELTYQPFDKFKVLLYTGYYDYSATSEEDAWHTPNAKVSLTSNYNLQDKILISSEIFFLDGIFTKINNNKLTIPAIFDMNLGIHYNYTKMLSFFIDLHNITAQKYSRWYKYPSYGLSIIAGATLSF